MMLADTCFDCDLCQTRNQIVWGQGHPSARIMFLGQDPGGMEDEYGTPFYYEAPAGAELDRLLGTIGLIRENVYISNSCKCHTPNDRGPTPEELAACRPFLMMEIAAIQPKIIVTMGVPATENLLGPVNMEAVHGIPFKKYIEEVGFEVIIIPAYHPAAGLRSPDFALKCVLDFAAVGAVLRGRLSPAHFQDSLAGKENYQVLTDPSGVEESLSGVSLLAMDTETLNWQYTPYLVQYSTAPGNGFIVYADNAKCLAVIANHVVQPDITTVIHNSLFDLFVLDRLKIYPANVRDTMIMAYLLQSEPLGLKPLAFRYWGMKMLAYEEIVAEASADLAFEYLLRVKDQIWPKPDQVLEIKPGGVFHYRQPQNIGKVVDKMFKDLAGGKIQRADLWRRWHDLDEEETSRGLVESLLGEMPEGNLSMINEKTRHWYAARDPDATLRVYPYLWSRIQEQGMEEVFNMDMAVIPMVKEMMETGILPNREALAALGVRFGNRIEELQAQIYATVGKQFNIGSPLQVADLLFNQLKIKFKFKHNKVTTNDKTMARLVAAHPVVPLIRQYRQYSKLKNTYTNKLAGWIQEDGRIHTSLNLTRVVTGRIASSRPNLTNQPTRSEDGKAIRKCFVPKEGCVFVSNDLCLTGDTHVQTTNGYVRVSDLQVGDLVLSTADGWHLSFEKVEAVQAVGEKRVCTLHMEDGSQVRCSANHRWMMLDGTFKETRDVHVGDRLAHIHDGISGPPDRLIPTWYGKRGNRHYINKHKLVAQTVLGKCPELFEIDHINGNFLEWWASNLRYLPAAENRAQGGQRYWKAVKNGKRSDAKRLKALRRGLKETRRSYVGAGNPNYGKRKGKTLTCQNPACGKSFYQPPCRNALYCSHKCYTDTGNHKVKRIEFSSETTQMWDIQVAGPHTFVLENGMVSHNSQIEMRMLAHESGDPLLAKIFKEGLDIHAITASNIFMVPIESLDEMKHRYPAKRVGFGVVYGITAGGLQEQLLMMGLDPAYWTIARCQRLIDDWFELYHDVEVYMHDLVAFALRHGYVEDMFGRRRYLETIHSTSRQARAEAARQAGNMPIQSGSAGVFKKGMANLTPIYKDFQAQGYYIHPIIPIHDDLVFEVEEDLVDIWVPIQQDVMEHSVILKVPIKSDAKIGRVSWGEGEKYKW